MQITEKIYKNVIVRIYRFIDKFITLCHVISRTNPDLGPHITVGRHTYGINQDTVLRAPSLNPPSVSVGNFCSIASGLIILANADHPTNLPSTYPFMTLLFSSKKIFRKAGYSNFDVVSRGAVVIGHDVWIGQNVIILSGVTIGIGAVIGAGSVVTKNIPPYAIAVGNPAQVIRYRFPPEIIDQMLNSEWWLLSDEQLRTLEPFLYNTDISAFLDQIRQVRSQKI
ncbi:MAG: CatB-related O-acetyltransferase [Candidatus Omnitrophica bacterium]|nr:CatB-related O-acetyltransferase [Candidatus Omnitrophota bacterium]